MFAPPFPLNSSHTYPNFEVNRPSSLNKRSVPSPATIVVPSPATFVVPSPATITEGRSTKTRKKDMKDGVNSLLMASIKRDLITTEAAVSNDKEPDTLFCLSLVRDLKNSPVLK